MKYCFTCKLDIISGLGSLLHIRKTEHVCMYFMYILLICGYAHVCGLWSDSICERLKLLPSLIYIRHHIKNVPVSLQFIFPRLKLSNSGERKTGRLTCATSEQMNDRSHWLHHGCHFLHYRCLWLDELLKKALGISVWGKQMICKTERSCCR